MLSVRAMLPAKILKRSVVVPSAPPFASGRSVPYEIVSYKNALKRLDVLPSGC